MTPAQRREAQVRAAAAAQDKRDHPLGYAVLWDREAPRTSQRRTAADVLGSRAIHRMVLGGNRSSKSELAAILTVAYLLGSDHPDVIRLAKRNGLDLSRSDIRPGGVDVVIVTPDFGDSRAVSRPKIARYLPAGCKWRNRDGVGEAEVTTPGGRILRFKSADQGRDGFQGFAVGLVVFDEEPTVDGVVEECRMRIVDQGGFLLFAMTPLYGWTALLQDLVREPREDVIVRWLHSRDNPHIPTEVLDAVLRSYGTHERAARERGDIVALEGRVYVDWQRHLHVVPAFVPPADWPRYAWVDFGVRNPTAIGWVAWDQRDDVLHLYREHYETERTTEWHGRRFQTLSEGEAIRWVVADAAATAERLTWATMGIATYPSPKGAGSVRAGISLCAERLAPDAMGRPHFVVHDSCPEFIREVESYVWDTTRRTGDLADAPLKKQDHHMDGWRYFVDMFGRTDGARAG